MIEGGEGADQGAEAAVEATEGTGESVVNGAVAGVRDANESPRGEPEKPASNNPFLALQYDSSIEVRFFL